MTSYLYLLSLIVSIGGLALFDRRYSIAFFKDKRATVLTILGSVVFFLLWDLLGIRLGIFFIGESQYLSGFRLAPELPIEEVFFLILLSYVTLLTWRKAETL